MDLTSLTSATGSTNFLDPAVATRATGKQVLDVNDFLKLITVQLTSQDPMKPMEDTQFISQMANFTSLEQMRTLSDNFLSFSTEQRASSAQNYLGKTVTVTTDTGEISGPVSKLIFVDGAPKLLINGVEYDAAKVTSVTAPSATSTTTSTSVSSAPTVPTTPAPSETTTTSA